MCHNIIYITTGALTLGSLELHIRANWDQLQLELPDLSIDTAIADLELAIMTSIQTGMAMLSLYVVSMCVAGVVNMGSCRVTAALCNNTGNAQLCSLVSSTQRFISRGNDTKMYFRRHLTFNGYLDRSDCIILLLQLCCRCDRRRFTTTLAALGMMGVLMRLDTVARF